MTDCGRFLPLALHNDDFSCAAQGYGKVVPLAAICEPSART